MSNFYFQSLSEEFRWNYSKFWMSILNRDMNGMKENSEKLGIDKLYPLLICMVTGRTWDAVVGGINKIKYSESEVSLNENFCFLTLCSLTFFENFSFSQTNKLSLLFFVSS